MYNRELVKQISHVMKYHTTIKNHITKVHHIISKKRRRQKNIYQIYVQTKWYQSVYPCQSIPGSPPHPTPQWCGWSLRRKLRRWHWRDFICVCRQVRLRDIWTTRTFTYTFIFKVICFLPDSIQARKGWHEHFCRSSPSVVCTGPVWDCLFLPRSRFP